MYLWTPRNSARGTGWAPVPATPWSHEAANMARGREATAARGHGDELELSSNRKYGRWPCQRVLLSKQKWGILRFLLFYTIFVDQSRAGLTSNVRALASRRWRWHQEKDVFWRISFLMRFNHWHKQGRGVPIATQPYLQTLQISANCALPIINLTWNHP